MNKIFITICLFTYLAFTGCKNQSNSHQEHSHSHKDHEHSTTHECHEHSHENHSHSLKEEEEECHEHHGHEHEEHEKHEHQHEVQEGKKNLQGVETQIIKKSTFNETIKTSGTILTPKSGEIIITARTHGLIRFDGKNLVPGLKVNEKEDLFRVSGENLAENNINVKVQRAKAQYELAKSNFERSKSLAADNIISQKDYSLAKANYEQAFAEYNNLNHNFVASSSKIQAPTNGYLKEVLVKEGDFVSDGQVLAVMIKNNKLLLKADVPQQYFLEMPKINDAVFIPSYTDKIFEISKLNGKAISYGRHTEENNYFTPFYFLFDYTSELLPGAYTEIYLRLKSLNNVLVVPKTALLEESGNYYLYVKHNGEFEKSYLVIGGDDGINVEVKKGIREGDEVVVKGAYLVKVANMDTSVPHSHSH